MSGSWRELFFISAGVRNSCKRIINCTKVISQTFFEYQKLEFFAALKAIICIEFNFSKEKKGNVSKRDKKGEGTGKCSVLISAICLDLPSFPIKLKPGKRANGAKPDTAHLTSGK